MSAPENTAWDALARELARWDDAGLTPTLWWRDDDAVAASPALAELRRVARGPLALAVIPAAPDRPLQASLAAALDGWAGVAVLQHGVSHRNNAPAGEKKSELPARQSCDGTAIQEGLAAGFASLRENFGGRFVPVLTPPWNRVHHDWLAQLPGLGFRGLSRFAEPPYRKPVPINGLIEINTQVDVIDWRGSRGFVGEAACLDRLTRHLAARRAGEIDIAMPTGILTHHLVHDAATWRFLENLQDWLARAHKGDLFLPAARLFGLD